MYFLECLTHLTKVSEWEKNGPEGIFEEIIAENFPKWMKDFHPEIQETQTPIKIKFKLGACKWEDG